jgi:predicted nucleotidyltransferase
MEKHKTELDAIKRKTRALLPHLVTVYGVKRLYLFGSIARNDATDTSDIDLLVEFEKVPDLLTFIDLEEYLSKQLRRKVDLVPKRKLHPLIKQDILKEAIAI